VLDGLSDLRIRSRADGVTAADKHAALYKELVSGKCPIHKIVGDLMQSAISFLEQHRIVVSAVGIALVRMALR
jgi:hypothetical protein